MPYGNFYYGKGGFQFKKMTAGGGRRNFALGAICNQPQDIYNSYVPGAGVGGTSIATRRAKLIRATKCYGGHKCGRFFTYLGIKPQQTITSLDIISEIEEVQPKPPLLIAVDPVVPSGLTSNSTYLSLGEVGYDFQVGIYNANSSTQYVNGSDIRVAYMAFDNVNQSNWTSNVSASESVPYSYNTSDGKYITVGQAFNQTENIIGSSPIAGEWLQIELPYNIILNKYSLSIAPLSSPYNFSVYRFPNTWYIVGSNDGNNWNIIDSRSGESVLNNTDYQTREYTILNSKSYSFYRIITTVVGSISDSNRKCVQINQWNLAGNAVIYP
jgi:hypothetical protein